MTPEQIKLVQASFVGVLPVASQAGAAFYVRLFELAPQLRPMFRANMAAQADKLMVTLAAVVRNLSRLDELVPTVVELARRHVDYGVQEAHYAVVGQALLDTLRDALGERFTRETEAAWAAAYTMLADTMIAGARRAA